MGLKKSNGTNPNGISEVVSEIEEENRAKMFDFPTSEDGIVNDEPLLAGIYDEETGETYDTFSYREMNGTDEEAINKADVRANPGRMLCTLVERCTTALGGLTKKEAGPKKWGQLIRKLTTGDLNYMSFKIRELSKGKRIEFTYKCPHCRKEMHMEVFTDEFEVTPFNGEFEVPFSLRRGIKDRQGNVHKDGTLRLLNGGDTEIVLPVFKKNESTGTTLTLTRIMEFDDGYKPSNREVAQMVTGDRDYLLELMRGMRFGVALNVDVVCDNCGEYIDAEVGTSNFF